MGLRIIATGTLAPWNTKILSPVPRNLEGWFEFDTDAARIGWNRAPGKASASIIGIPAIAASHARFKGLENFVQTAIKETAELTVLVVGKAAAAIPGGASISGDASTPAYVSSYNGPSTNPAYPGTSTGASLYHVATTTMTGTGARDNSSGALATGSQILSGETPTSWGLRVLRLSSSSPIVVNNLTTSASATGSLSTLRVPADRAFRIGSAYANFGAEVDISQVIIHSARLTDDETAAIAAVMRKRAARLGIAV